MGCLRHAPEFPEIFLAALATLQLKARLEIIFGLENMELPSSAEVCVAQGGRPHERAAKTTGLYFSAINSAEKMSGSESDLVTYNVPEGSLEPK